MRRSLVFVLGGIAILVLVIVFLVLIGKKEESTQGRPQAIILEEAEETFIQGNLLGARRLYQEAMENISDVDKLEEVRKTIEDINIRIIFSPVIDECSEEYVVKSGDSLAKISKGFNTTVSLIKRANNLKSDTIRPGQKLKITTCTFSIAVDKSQNLLFLKSEGEVIKTYVVATGKNNCTPTGTFKITGEKIKNPTWFKTGAVIPPNSPENILGSRWMAIDKEGYGIHGTTEPENLGQQVTMGCIRMRNEDIDDLFDIVPGGTEVIIVD